MRRCRLVFRDTECRHPDIRSAGWCDNSLRTAIHSSICKRCLAAGVLRIKRDGVTGATGGIVKSVTASIPAKVLLVDDDEQQLELRAYVLRMAGYSVFPATGPLQA